MKEDLLKIIKHYGVNAQQRKLAEEVFELQEAITERECLYNNDCSIGQLENAIRHITEEIADILNLLDEFICYYGIKIEDIANIRYQKIERQLKRIEETKINESNSI